MPLPVMVGAQTSAVFAQSATSALFAGSTAGATGAVVFSNTLTVASAVRVSGTFTASTVSVSAAFGLGVSAAGRQVHLADPLDLTALLTIVPSILDILETFGFVSAA